MLLHIAYGQSSELSLGQSKHLHVAAPQHAWLGFG